MPASKTPPAHHFPQRTQPARTGFIALDAGFALALALALLMVMSVLLVRQRAAEKQLAEIRALNRAAENALLTVQAGSPPAPECQWTPLPAPAPAGFQWMQVTASSNSLHRPAIRGVKDASLVGLVPLAPPERAP